MSLEVIEFVDITTFSPWAEIADVKDTRCEICIAKGEVVQEDNDQVTIALIVNKEKTTCCERAVIPKGTITSRRVIEDGS